MMPYEYLEDGVTADVTFVATGHDLDEVFAAAADATTNVMVGDLSSLAPTVHRSVALEDDALDLLLKRFLDELVFIKDVDGLLLRPTRTRVEQTGDRYHLTADLAGEPIDPAKHELQADVKGVTLYGLLVEQTDAGWRARATLDV
jgi:SHS2 domain-containing protein